MRIKCNNCGREMYLGELIGYAEAYLLKAVAPIIVDFLLQTLKDSLLTPKKGFIDNQMASAATIFGVSCPKCKKIDCWDPAPEVVTEQKNENQSASL